MKGTLVHGLAGILPSGTRKSLILRQLIVKDNFLINEIITHYSSLLPRRGVLIIANIFLERID
jgi:hypothetical protein